MEGFAYVVGVWHGLGILLVMIEDGEIAIFEGICVRS